MKRAVSAIVVAAVAAIAVARTSERTSASSHREALAILNEPCADNTDTFAWVSNGTHDKLYLVMDFNPLHEPGQGNQGLRACNGYRYEFHIAKGKSLAERVVYRVEFANRLNPEAAPSPTDPLGGGNELLWQITGGTETMKVTRIVRDDDDWGHRRRDDDDTTVLGRNLTVLPNNHGPQTDRLVYGLGPFKGYDSGDATSREVGLYDQAFVDTYIHPLSNGGRVIAGQFDDPYQLDEKKASSTWSTWRAPISAASRARGVHRPRTCSPVSISPPIALEIPMNDIFPHGVPHNGQLRASSTDSLLRVWSRSAVAKRRPLTPTTSSPASRDPASGRRLVETPFRSSTPAWSEHSVKHCICVPARIMT